MVTASDGMHLCYAPLDQRTSHSVASAFGAIATRMSGSNGGWRIDVMRYHCGGGDIEGLELLLIEYNGVCCLDR